MAEVNLLKLSSTSLAPATEEDVEALSHIKIGEVVRCKYSRMRNIKFHRKYFSLLNYLYDVWEPAEVAVDDKRFVPEKSFETFRKNIAVMSGYYDTHFTIAGDPRIEAKSISFANMKEEEFEKLYSNTIDVGLKHILHNHSREDVDNVVQNLIGFM